MSLLKQKRNVYDILNNTDSYPYAPDVAVSGVSIVNDGADIVTVVINDGDRDISLNVLPSNAYDGDFKRVHSVNVTAGTTYQIELRYQ